MVEWQKINYDFDFWKVFLKKGLKKGGIFEVLYMVWGKEKVRKNIRKNKHT